MPYKIRQLLLVQTMGLYPENFHRLVMPALHFPIT